VEGLESKNFYEMLGLPLEATTEQVREAYKEIARVYHPDSTFYTEIVGASLTEQDMSVFKIITNAYNTLINPEKRTEYDKLIPKNLKGWEDDQAAYADKSASANHTQTTADKSKKAPPTRSGFGQIVEDEDTEDTATEGPKSIREMIKDREERVRKRQLLVLGTAGATLLIMAVIVALVYFAL